MKLLTRTELEALIQERRGPCVSFYLQTHRPGAEIQPQDRIRLKNMVRDAQQDLVDRGLRAADVRQMLTAVQDLQDDGLFWRSQSGGLAIFRSPDLFLCYQVPLQFEEVVVAGDRFYVKPLLPLLSDDGEFYVLAISLNAVRFLRGTRHSMQQIDVKDLPASLADAMRFNNPQRQLQFHTDTEPRVGERPAEFFGHGVGKDDEKSNVLQYFYQVDKGLHDQLHDERAPLILAGTAYLFPIYREANTYPHLLDSGVEGNPEGWSDAELHDRAWMVVEPLFRQEREKAEEAYRRSWNTPRASNNVDEIAVAAHDGRVDVAFVAGNMQQWGSFDPRTQSVAIHESRAPGDEDLLDLIAVQTLLHGGSVYVMDAALLPDGGRQHPAAAVFRF